LTRTVQPLTWVISKATEKTETNENIREALLLCDSLDKLYETLNRLEYIIRRKNIDISVIQKGQEGIL